MTETPYLVSIVQGYFPELVSFIIELGLAERTPSSVTRLPVQVFRVEETIITDGPLPKPFSLSPNRISSLVLQRHPEPVEQNADSNILLAALVLTRLSGPECIRNRPLFDALKSLNLLRLVCTITVLRHTAHAHRSASAQDFDTLTGEPRTGRIGFTYFLRRNPARGQAYALEHDLSPDVVATMRAGMLMTQLLSRPKGCIAPAKMTPPLSLSGMKTPY